ncbi:UNVERIFIED_CONTAM: hypothetical protein PYX00_008463 [Menopon gallinae]|uniref:EGF-like domain-containing protein n=1 Tax=Menopon gallinae TaxID=328185 RepID=A0AAW2HPF4_9NEOP
MGGILIGRIRINVDDEDGRGLGLIEPRYNLATKVMSNGVEVIVATDRNRPGEPEFLRLLSSTVTRPITLAPHTLTNHMSMVLASEKEDVASSLHIPASFATRTYYTTYAYLSTMVQNGETSVSTKKITVTNVRTEEAEKSDVIAPTSTREITLTESPSLQTEVFHTAYTYLNTIVDGEQPLVMTTHHTVSNTVTAQYDYFMQLEPSEVYPTTNTYFKTVEFTRTLTDGTDSQIVSTQNVLTQVVVTDAFDRETVVKPMTTEVTKTYFVTYTYFSTFIDGDRTKVKSDVSVSSDVTIEKFYIKPKKTATTKYSEKMTSVTRTAPLNIVATRTYLTTFTYFTTLLQGPSGEKAETIVTTRTRVMQNVVTETLSHKSFDSDYLMKLQNSLEVKGSGNIVTTATLKGGDQMEITVFKAGAENGGGLHSSSGRATPPATTSPPSQTTFNDITAEALIAEENEIVESTVPLSTTSSVIPSNHNFNQTEATLITPTKPVVLTPTRKEETEETQPSSKKPPKVTTDHPVNFLNLTSLGINGINVLGPVFNAVADLINNNMKAKVNETTPLKKVQTVKKPASSNINPILNLVSGLKATIEPKHKSTTTRTPVYIPVGSFAEDHEVAESQVVPQKWLDTQGKNLEKNRIDNGITILEGGIPISPGQIITTNSDVIIGRPGSSGPRPPNFAVKNNIPIDMKPPPPPLTLELPVDDVVGQHSTIKNVKPNDHKHRQKHKPHDSGALDLNPPPAPPVLNVHRPITINHKPHEIVPYKPDHVETNIIPIPVHLMENYVNGGVGLEAGNKATQSNHVIIQEGINSNMEDRSTGHPLLVNIQPSQVANVVIPPGSSTALIINNEKQHSLKGEVIDDPSPHPEPETVGFVGAEPVLRLENGDLTPPLHSVHHRPEPNRPFRQQIPNKVLHGGHHYHFTGDAGSNRIPPELPPNSRPFGQGHHYRDVITNGFKDPKNPFKVGSGIYVDVSPPGHLPPRPDFGQNHPVITKPPPGVNENFSNHQTGLVHDVPLNAQVQLGSTSIKDQAVKEILINVNKHDKVKNKHQGQDKTQNFLKKPHEDIAENLHPPPPPPPPVSNRRPPWQYPPYHPQSPTNYMIPPPQVSHRPNYKPGPDPHPPRPLMIPVGAAAPDQPYPYPRPEDIVIVPHNIHAQQTTHFDLDAGDSNEPVRTEDGEEIQESNARPLLPGQLPTELERGNKTIEDGGHTVHYNTGIKYGVGRPYTISPRPQNTHFYHNKSDNVKVTYGGDYYNEVEQIFGSKLNGNRGQRPVVAQESANNIRVQRPGGSQESANAVLLHRPQDNRVQRPVSAQETVNTILLQRPAGVQDNRVQRPVNTQENGVLLQRPAGVQDNRVQRPVNTQENGVLLQRPAGVQDNRVQRPVSTQENGVLLQRPVGSQILQRPVTAQNQRPSPESVNTILLQRPIGTQDNRVQRPQEIILQRPVSPQDNRLHRPIPPPQRPADPTVRPQRPAITQETSGSNKVRVEATIQKVPPHDRANISWIENHKPEPVKPLPPQQQSTKRPPKPFTIPGIQLDNLWNKHGPPTTKRPPDATTKDWSNVVEEQKPTTGKTKPNVSVAEDKSEGSVQDVKWSSNKQQSDRTRKPENSTTEEVRVQSDLTNHRISNTSGVEYKHRNKTTAHTSVIRHPGWVESVSVHDYNRGPQGNKKHAVQQTSPSETVWTQQLVPTQQKPVTEKVIIPGEVILDAQQANDWIATKPTRVTWSQQNTTNFPQPTWHHEDIYRNRTSPSKSPSTVSDINDLLTPPKATDVMGLSPPPPDRPRRPQRPQRPKPPFKFDSLPLPSAPRDPIAIENDFPPVRSPDFNKKPIKPQDIFPPKLPENFIHHVPEYPVRTPKPRPSLRPPVTSLPINVPETQQASDTNEISKIYTSHADINGHSKPVNDRVVPPAKRPKPQKKPEVPIEKQTEKPRPIAPSRTQSEQTTPTGNVIWGSETIFEPEEFSKYETPIIKDTTRKMVTTLVSTGSTTIFGDFYTPRPTEPKPTRKPVAPTYTTTLTVTTTMTTVVHSIGQKPSTKTIVLTKTILSTVVDKVTETQTLVKPTTATVTQTHTIATTKTALVVPTGIRPTPTRSHPGVTLKPEIFVADPHSKDTMTISVSTSMNKDKKTEERRKYNNGRRPEVDENDSILVVMTNKHPKVNLSKEHFEDETKEVEEGGVFLGGVFNADTTKRYKPPIWQMECVPECRPTRNERCQKLDGTMKCVCRPGFARMFPDRPCMPTYTYNMRLLLDKSGEEHLEDLDHSETMNYVKLKALTKEGLDRMIMQSDLRDVFHGVLVNGFEPKQKKTMVDFYVQLSENTDEGRLMEVFKKTLKHSNYSLGGTELYAAREADTLEADDFNECLHPKFHDCSENARCFNLRGTYTCSCKEGFTDLSENSQFPGRMCSDMIGCEYCGYHGTCYTRDDNQITCECFQWYSGERCRINLKVLLIALVTIGSILLALLLVCGILTCLKRKSRSSTASKANGSSGYLRYRGPPTLDKRAMITADSSSESSVDILPYINPPPPPPPSGTLSAKRKPVLRQNVKGPAPRPKEIAAVEQQDRSVTVMIPRAKYRPVPPMSPLMTMSTFSPDKHLQRTSAQLSTEQKLINYLEGNAREGVNNEQKSSQKTYDTPRAAPPFKKEQRVFEYEYKTSNMQINDGTSSGERRSKHGDSDRRFRRHSDSTHLQSENSRNFQHRKYSAGALVSAGFEVSATVGLRHDFDTSEDEHSGILNTSTMKSNRSQFTTLNRTGDHKTMSEARSYDETTIHPPTRTLKTNYSGSSPSSRVNNDEGHTMVERDLGSTFIMPESHLFKPERDRGSDISTFDSL